MRDACWEGKLYYTKEAIWKAIQDPVAIIDRDYLKKLVTSLPDRLCDAIAKKENIKKYGNREVEPKSKVVILKNQLRVKMVFP